MPCGGKAGSRPDLRLVAGRQRGAKPVGTIATLPGAIEEQLVGPDGCGESTPPRPHSSAGAVPGPAVVQPAQADADLPGHTQLVLTVA